MMVLNLKKSDTIEIDKNGFSIDNIYFEFKEIHKIKVSFKTKSVTWSMAHSSPITRSWISIEKINANKKKVGKKLFPIHRHALVYILCQFKNNNGSFISKYLT